jgi:dephospho-CoA kinase
MCRKNRYADEFGAQEGVTVIDVDRLVMPRWRPMPIVSSRRSVPGVLAADGSIDRKALGSIVFADSRLLAQLEAISHPWMVEECARLVSAARASGRRAVVLNAALLHRMGLDRLCDVVVFIKAPFYERYRRAKERDHVSWQISSAGTGAGGY